MNKQSPISAAARLDLDAMRCFLATAESRSVQAAAARLGRTPSAISMQIKKLEGILSAPLFERARSGMSLTVAGERLMPHARRMIEAEQAAREAMIGESLRGRVRVGLIEDIGGVRLADALTAYARSHAHVSVEMVMSSSRTLAPMLEDGSLDLAILTPGGDVSGRADDILLHEEPLYWAMKKGSDLWRERPLPLAVYSQGCAWRQAIVKALDEADLPYRIAYQSDYYLGQVAVVSAGLAIAPLPASQLVPGLEVLGEEDGVPTLGMAQVVLRYGPDRNPAAQALGQRFCEMFAC